MSIIGLKAYTWTVKEKYNDPSKKYCYDYLCVCECGNEKVFTKGNIERLSISKCDQCEREEILDSKFEEYNSYYENLNGCSLDRASVNLDDKHKLMCDKNHKFEVSIRKYDGCGKCKRVNSSRDRADRERELKTSEGHNFLNTYPYQSKFWDYDKNELRPEEVLPVSKKRYHFICENGHSFTRSPAQIKKGSWCDMCSDTYVESRIASIIKIVCKSIFEDVKFEKEFPIDVIIDGEKTTLYPDIIIEDLKLNIEIHGKQHYSFSKKWHTNRSEFIRIRNRDKYKTSRLKEMGYRQYIFNATDNLDVDIALFEQFLRVLLDV